MSNTNNTSRQDVVEDEEEVALPGFRFHPTDEELVGFYLRRKVDKKPLSVELIKQVDIYKFDPWDLPKPNSVGQKEGYFFCRRGRKYRNSIRPNRVTGSGFWKATGIDKPVYSQGGEGRDCIGLKKTLVYYRGSAGKGTKTDWMMHEFRLPLNDPNNTSNLANAKSSPQEAEVWTLCRIFKRNVTHRKYTPDWRELSNKRQATAVDTNSKSCSVDSNSRENYLSFATPDLIHYTTEKKPVLNFGNERKQFQLDQFSSIAYHHNNYHHHNQLPSMGSSSTISSSNHENELFGYGDWDELRSVVEFAFDPSLL